MPDTAVVLADVFLMVSPLGSVTTPAALIVVLAVAPMLPASANRLGVVSTPAAETVVLPVAPKVEIPSAPSVPPVKIFVLMVDAA